MTDDPTGSGELAATAVEVAPERAAVSGFAQGLCTGLVLAAAAVHVWLARELAPLASMYRELGSASLPALTRLALSRVWSWGWPLMGLAVAGGLIWWRPRGLVAYVLAAVMVVGAAVVTWYFARAPMWSMAETIRAD